MVLKVVTVKIFKTLGLSGRLITAFRWSPGVKQPRIAIAVASRVRLSKIAYYLIDNV